MPPIRLNAALVDIPLIAILRGVKPQEVLEIAQIIYQAGIKVIEIPLNSPEPYNSIEILQQAMGDEAVIGAGTVTNIEQVKKIHAVGGRLIVSPNTNIAVIKRSKQLGLYSAPGFYTPSEAFAAIEAGADALKMFPADTLGTKGLKAIAVVLPPEMPIFPVGGVNADNMADFIAVGASGFGLGSGLYKAGMTAEQVGVNAAAYVKAIQNAKSASKP
ncbi:MAG: 2-dehydro-3-deoxy-6-phosphogalactonate aldolase [Hyphomicrobiales bacterium]|nr:MAG: 2-dehydro-3-deoxy-6-phosphogalactonate aldolase [Hyphomicrobiales bacterium]